MQFVLVRIDDRLIHGQVTCAWGAWLEPKRIVLVNDEVASTGWKRDLYYCTDALGAEIAVLTKEDFLAASAEGRWGDERTIVLVETPEDLLDLVKSGLAIETANVGGMHFREGKREVLPYVYVDADDLRAMNELLKTGVRLEARDVPQAQSVDLEPALRRMNEELERTEDTER